MKNLRASKKSMKRQLFISSEYFRVPSLHLECQHRICLYVCNVTVLHIEHLLHLRKQYLTLMAVTFYAAHGCMLMNISSSRKTILPWSISTLQYLCQCGPWE